MGIVTARRLVVVFQQPGEIKTAGGSERRGDCQESGLRAGLFQVIGPLFNQKTRFAVKLSHLPLLGPVECLHGKVIVQIRGTRPPPINRARPGDAQHQHDDANFPEPRALFGGRPRSGWLLNHDASVADRDEFETQRVKGAPSKGV